MRKFFKILFVASATILLAGYLIPERKAMQHLLLHTSIMVLLRQSPMCGGHSAQQAHVILQNDSIGG